MAMLRHERIQELETMPDCDWQLLRKMAEERVAFWILEMEVTNMFQRNAAMIRDAKRQLELMLMLTMTEFRAMFLTNVKSRTA